MPPLSTLPPPFPYTTLFRSSSLYPYPALSLPTEIFQPMVMLLRVDVRRGGGASADARRGHSSPSFTATPERPRSEEHTSELQSRFDLVCRLLLEKQKHRRRC